VIPDIKFVEDLRRGRADYFDMLGFNAPGYAAPPDERTRPGPVQRPLVLLRHVEDVRAVMVANGGEDKQIAVLELGWTTDPIHPDYKWFTVGEALRPTTCARLRVRPRTGSPGSG
jgi:hypothetical protein